MRIKLFITLLILTASSACAQDWIKVQGLEGLWRFNIGDNPEWKSPSYNDSKWELVKVPSSWENEGFHGYDGYGWYRKSFKVSSSYNNLYLSMGYIDDVDQVFLNGHLIGASGLFPPNYETAYDAKRNYPIPEEYLKHNEENIIAVRVYDAQLEGGIMSGSIGIYTHGLNLTINLSGQWKFRQGDDLAWRDKDYPDKDWKELIVPEFWENQGYKTYDGFAWYRKNFYLNGKTAEESLVLVMGKIDDIDEVYLNGRLIGSSGDMGDRSYLGDTWQKTRGYFIPRELLIPNGWNVIAVRVYDGYLGGGIYQGPVGLAVQKEYKSYWNERRKKKNFFEKIFE
ncbi:MAG TPA: beta galactosidase jelly roll domain-containing protein [Ignavibacteriales bacterium]|nr:beta galactosidase jelly roll domain-containing protein [Ignavibacteriales bacterium]